MVVTVLSISGGRASSSKKIHRKKKRKGSSINSNRKGMGQGSVLYPDHTGVEMAVPTWVWNSFPEKP